MCPSYNNCDSCYYGRPDLCGEKECRRFTGRTPFCDDFKCIEKDCKRFECISFDEEYLIYNDL